MNIKLNETQVREIFRMRAKGSTYTQIGKKFKVKAGSVGSILRGTSWKHIHAEFPNQPLMIGEKNTKTEIVHLRKKGLTLSAIAKHFKVKVGFVKNMLLNGHSPKDATQIGPPPKIRFSKLRRTDVRKAISLRGKGLSYREIAKHFGDIVTYQQIHKIISGHSRILNYSK
jgi:hypothetical protein